MVKFVSNLLGILEGKGIKFEYLRWGNASENIIILLPLCQKKVIELEYTYPGSPRHNGRVEKK